MSKCTENIRQTVETDVIASKSRTSKEGQKEERKNKDIPTGRNKNQK